jgi:hypothetical protein
MRTYDPYAMSGAILGGSSPEEAAPPPQTLADRLDHIDNRVAKLAEHLEEVATRAFGPVQASAGHAREAIAQPPVARTLPCCLERIQEHLDRAVYAAARLNQIA